MLGHHDQQLVLQDLEQLSEYYERLYNMELEVDVHWDEDYIVLVNHPLPAGYAIGHIPVLLPLDGFPFKPPPGLHVPRQSPATPQLARSYALFQDGPPPYSRTHDLVNQGWSWLCLRKKTGSGDGWSWDYKYTTGGVDSLMSLFAVFDAENKRAL